MRRPAVFRAPLSVALAIVLAAAPAGAQVPAGPPPMPDTLPRPAADTVTRPAVDTAVVPRAPHGLASDGTRLRAGRWVYAVAVIGPGDTTTSLGVRAVEIAPQIYSGAPAWLIVGTGGRGELQSVDSLLVSQSELRPLHWSSILGLARLAAELPGDTMFAATSAPTGKQSVVLGVPRDALVSAELTAAMLQLAPLAEGWRDSVHVVALTPGGNSVDPAELAVVASERTTVPAGEFDCWVVELRSWRGTERLWVDKGDQTVVRREQELPRAPGARLQRALVSAPPR